MNSSPRGVKHADAWIAVLRIGVGLWFTKSLFTKVDWVTLASIPMPTAGERWSNFLSERLAEYAAGNPLGWYRRFLLEFAVPNAELFAVLTALGEAAVGLALISGLLTRAGAVGGAFLMSNYLLASYWMGPSQQGFHLVLLLAMATFIGADAGKKWGLDGWLHSRRARLGPRLRGSATPARRVASGRA